MYGSLEDALRGAMGEQVQQGAGLLLALTQPSGPVGWQAQAGCPQAMAHQHPQPGHVAV